MAKYFSNGFSHGFLRAPVVPVFPNPHRYRWPAVPGAVSYRVLQGKSLVGEVPTNEIITVVRPDTYEALSAGRKVLYRGKILP